ncbi:MAG: hypothetical protein CBE33_05310 [Candidatus Pelagibacter sp. TMED273]|nr:MAG: hypothetical protein CBE33_05310 [Candidatus Pelagibacter sp. TMED273]|tara:strand:+ start:7046 stop:7675 length:630 start_codon:yes stop_codon:yes gene_type:complete
MKADNMLGKIKELLNIEAKVEEVKLEQATLENGTVIESENFEAGSEVFIVTEDEKVALPVGEYTLEDGERLIIKEEGIIASIGEKEEEPKEEASEENLNTDNMENKEVVQEVQENLEEDKKEEMQYATKEELASLKKDIEEIKGMIDKMGKHKEEEMSAEDKPIEEKEELSAVEKVKHNPEEEVKTEPVFMSRRSETTFDRVMRRINNI